MRILDAGLLTTVQDLGRFGFAKEGVSPAGAMDPIALRVANSLVGNEQAVAGLEVTLKGPRIEFESPALIAICGADVTPRIADVEVPCWCAIFVRAGAVLEFGEPGWGCRAYLAVAGGLDVAEVMGSRSTYLRAHFGGFEGRALRTGDRLPVGRAGARAANIMASVSDIVAPLPFALAHGRIRDSHRLYRRDTIRILRGPHFDMMDPADTQMLTSRPFQVSQRADRMGYRLTGTTLASVTGSELISTAVLTGTIQVPPSGEPIVLMADRQTTGGYPMVGQVISADVPSIAQLKPGDEVRFEEATRAQAYGALRRREQMVAEMGEVRDRASSRP